MSSGGKSKGMSWGMVIVWIVGVIGVVVVAGLAVWAYAVGGFTNLIASWAGKNTVSNLAQSLDPLSA